ncbi:hypothetical protein A9996_18745 [Gelidibacter algens]|nr:hypothetical protein A9996_18745 [Gelidibacter algens]
MSCNSDDSESLPVDNISDLKLENLNFLSSNIPEDFYDDLTFVDELTGYAVSRIGKIVKTIDGGTTWTVLNSAANFPLKKIQFIDQYNGYIIGGDDTGSYILKTINAGNTWSIINLNTVENGSPNGMYFKNKDVGFITGNRFFKKTADGGQTWTNVLPNSIEDYQRVNFNINKTLGYVTFNSSNYLKTNDGGSTWQLVEERADYRFSEIYFVENQVFFKSNLNVVNLNFNKSIEIPSSAHKLLYLTVDKCIGIGQHYEIGFLPYGDVLFTNDNWDAFLQRSYQPASESMVFTAIAKMSKHKTMMLGTGQIYTKIVVLTY